MKKTPEIKVFKEETVAMPKKLNTEMILRKSLRDSGKEYIQNCSLAGAKQMCDPDIGILERLMWTIIFILSGSAVIYFLIYTWNNTLTKPLIVTMESSEYPIGKIDFPAIAICNINRISKKALQKFAEDEYPDIAQNHETLEEVQRLLLNFGRLIDYTYNESERNHPVIKKMIEKYQNQPEKIIDIMKMLAPSCKDMLLRCTWAGEPVDCDELFNTQRTANRGHCCIFNYVLDYKVMRSGVPLEQVKRQSTPGYVQGLSVILDPMLDDYAYPLNNIRGSDVLMFNPKHYPDIHAGRVVHRMSEPNAFTLFELKSTKQVATAETKKYSLETRKCLFHDEFSDDFFNMYSYSTCISLCRLMTVQSLCKCTPFFLVAHNDYLTSPVCTLEDLKCLNKYREKFYYLYPHDAEDYSGLETELEDSINCNCFPDCEDTSHKTKCIETEINFSGKDYSRGSQDFVFDGIDMRNKSVICVYHPTTDATLMRLDVVSYWYEVLSNVSGFAGMIFGFSILSVIEFFYFFMIRFIRHIFVNFKRYH